MNLIRIERGGTGARRSSICADDPGVENAIHRGYRAGRVAICATAVAVRPGAVIVLRTGCTIMVVVGQSGVMVAVMGAEACCGPVMMVVGYRLVIRMVMTVFVADGMAVAGVRYCCHDDLSGDGRNGHH